VTAVASPERAETITALGASFKRAMVAVRRLRGRETHRPGTPSFAQYQLLFSMDGTAALSAGELAAAADLSPATVTHMLDSLVELGFVTRDRSSQDRRVVACSLTPDGKKLIAERRRLFEARWADALADLPATDLAAAAAVLERIAAMFDEFDSAV
jgi:DNA-binding MarR family transcriptional regulator